MRGARVWVVAIFVSVLAGCLGDEAGPVADAPGVAHDAGPAAATETTGAIQGSVSSDLFEPLGGAVVVLLETGAETVVARNGRFVFNELEPGTYRVAASRDGYAPDTRPATVRAGDVADVVFHLAPVAAAAPWSELHEQVGLILDGEAYQVEVGGECHTVPTDVFDVRSCWYTYSRVNAEHVLNITADIETLLIEVVWDPAGPLGEYLQLDLLCPDEVRRPGDSYFGNDCYEIAPGTTSPLIIRLDRDVWGERGTWVGDWSTRVFPGYGMLGTYDTAGVDAGVSYQQSFTFYFSYFHVAPAPEGYSAIPDA